MMVGVVILICLVFVRVLIEQLIEWAKDRQWKSVVLCLLYLAVSCTYVAELITAEIVVYACVAEVTEQNYDSDVGECHAKTDNMTYSKNINSNSTEESKNLISIIPRESCVDNIEWFIIEGSARHLEMSELDSLTQDELRLVRNGWFARCGRMFTEYELFAFYSNYSWYRPRYSPCDFDWSYLNLYQKDNIELIKQLERKLINAEPG